MWQGRSGDDSIGGRRRNPAGLVSALAAPEPSGTSCNADPSPSVRDRVK